MNTKKLKSFEYAGKVHPGTDDLAGLHRQEAFNTSFGHVVVVVASEGIHKKQEELAGIVAERMQYYMDHADDEKVEDITTSALKYSSGYLYQLARRDPLNTPAKISCLCLLNHENTLCYSWAGDQVCVSLWDGKKLYPLLTHADDDTHGLPENEGGGQEKGFVGQEADLSPNSASIPLKPLSGDCLLVGSGSICHELSRKDVRKVIQDSMPLQTKLLRIMGLCDKEKAHIHASLMLISFYRVNHTKRVFVAGKENKRGISRGGSSTAHHAQEEPEKKKSSTVRSHVLKYAMLMLACVLLGYMVYDLFIFDPRPPVRLPAPTPVEAHDTIADAPEEGVEVLDDMPPFPDDELYIVRGGDTWSRIYRQYQVCSWFIINHPRNTGRFGRDGSLIAGQQLRIPVRYSGDQELNPFYYREFTASKVGRGCEHAGQDFLDTFHEKYEPQ